MIPPAQLVTTKLPPEARAVVDDFARRLEPLSWPDRSRAFEKAWCDVAEHQSANAAFFAPGEGSLVWRVLVTAALERLRLRTIKNIDAAAWAFLTLHPEWRALAEKYLRTNATELVLWGTDHPLHDTIAGAIDKDAGRDAPAPMVN